MRSLSDRAPHRRAHVAFSAWTLGLALAFTTHESARAQGSNGNDQTTSPRWRVVGGGPASQGGVFCPQILVSPAGVPHVAYQDFTSNFHQLAVRRLVGNEWVRLTTAGGSSEGDAWYNRMGFQRNGALVVASRDYGLHGAMGVRRCAGPDQPWELVGGVPASLGGAHHTDVLVVGDGTIAAAFQDSTTDVSGRATVVEFDGNAWRVLGRPGLSIGFSQYQSLALARDGSILCAFTDNGLGGKATVLRWTGAANGWEPLGQPGFTPDQPNNLQLCVAPDGTPHVVYYVWGSRIVVRRFDGTGWPTLGPPVDGADVPTVETEGWRQWLSLDFDPQGRAWVAYQAANLGRKAVVKRWDRSLHQWETIGAPGFTPAAADYLSMDLDPDGRPYVAFRDALTMRALVMTWQ